MENIQNTPYPLSDASHSSTTIDPALSHSTLQSPTDVPSKGSKGDQSASQSQTSFSPLLARARAGTPGLTSSPGSSKTKFLKAIFDSKRKDNKQASEGSLNTMGRSSQASSCISPTPPTTSSSSRKKNDSTRKQPSPTSFADLAYRYGGPSFKTPRL